MKLGTFIFKERGPEMLFQKPHLHRKQKTDICYKGLLWEEEGQWDTNGSDTQCCDRHTNKVRP